MHRRPANRECNTVASCGILADMASTKRAERIQSPSILLPFRDPDGAITVADVWREDILEWRPDPNLPSQFYLVLDFGTEQRATGEIVERSTPLPEPLSGVQVLPEPVYVDTGRVQLELQPVDITDVADWDLDTGEGLGPPVTRFADVPTEELGDVPTDEPRVGRPMVGWIRHPVSGRRTA